MFMDRPDLLRQAAIYLERVEQDNRKIIEQHIFQEAA